MTQKTETTTDKLKPSTSIPMPALILGLGGLIPFIGSALILWVGNSSTQFDTAHALVAYAAVILSFLGGINWGAALLNRELDRPAHDFTAQLVWSVVPSLIAWFCLLLQALLNHAIPLLLLLVAFVLQYILDRRSVASGRLPPWFARLRLILTSGAVLSLAAGLVRMVLG